MNTEYFIAQRLIKGKSTQNNYSQPIIKIAVAGISIGLVVMLIAVAVLTGFKQTVSDKVIGFGAHLQINNFDNNVSYETLPIQKEQTWKDAAKNIEHVNNIQAYITKAGIIQTDKYLHGIVLKGVDTDFSWDFFKEYLIEGDTLTITNEKKTNGILISAFVAKKLDLKLGDKIKMYFIQDPPRIRQFKISGIYNSQLEEMDKVFVYADIKHLQKLNNWGKNQISGFEVQLDDLKNLEDVDYELTRLVSTNFSPNQEVLSVENIYDQYPHIYDWLNVQNKNMWVVLILMVIVAGFNMISALLIIILERTNMVGILKSMGTTNISIRKIFLYHAAFLIGRGLLWGNIIGIGICLIQKYFGIIQMDPATYYVSTIPINISIPYIILLNIGTIIVTILMLIIPSYLVTRISPSEAMHID